jgi:DNA repair protein RecO (recombination protein O)
MFYYVDISKISSLEISNDSKKEIHLFLEQYYDRYTGLYLKSKSLLNQLNKLNV